jgi:hypothetical protein
MNLTPRAANSCRQSRKQRRLSGSTHGGQLGDLIVAVGGKAVATFADLSLALDEVGIGKEARLAVVRDGRRRERNGTRPGHQLGAKIALMTTSGRALAKRPEALAIPRRREIALGQLSILLRRDSALCCIS